MELDLARAIGIRETSTAVGGGPIVVAVEALLAGLPGPPTPLASVAQRLGVDRISFRSGLPVSGMLERVGDSFRVVCAADQSAGRRRFTVAHELGHAYLATHESELPGHDHEYFCDRFAAELLMPTQCMKENDLDSLSITRLRRLSKRFGASFRATAIRCAEFGDLAVIVTAGSKVEWSAGQVRELDPFLAEVSARTLAQRERIRQRVSRDAENARENWLLETDGYGPGRALLLLRRES